ncbi:MULTISPECIES: triple tyrosine motif-containing protein [unclassified Leeuwenhoekiella]|uniref:triple tyrosine motif-containing protein n=1 Tax=unclassified Leeuwenhoekiella TaxID=2615029 RepID=UPI0025BE8CDE|nr:MULTISPECIES: triple tyrosine motif-containing protein [unclassified Leeuwenhoekiella]|tara:strand:- start:25385 stop:28303 length:2919 start_codon:yes stop_codon:yes gene_type:complete
MNHYFLLKNAVYEKALLVFFLFTCLSFAQQNNLFENQIPKITSYTRSDFEADGQFWTMTEDDEGVLYFGNNDGIIVYDGERWQKVTLPNHSTVRSLVKAKNNTIYVGGFNEIGILKKTSNGGYYYHSLSEELNLETENLENLWQVHEFKNAIIYRSFSELTVINANTASHVKANVNFLYSGIVNDHLYVQDQNTGIFEFDPKNNTLTKLFESPSVEGIVSFLPVENVDEFLIVTKPGIIYLANRKTGKLVFQKRLFKPEDQEQILVAAPFQDHYLVGTLTNKVLKLKANLEKDPSTTNFKRLTNSSVLNIYPQEEKDRFWVLMNNGIDLVEFDSPEIQLFDGSSIADIELYNDILYLATNTGVYYAPFNLGLPDVKELNFTKIPDLEGQAWSVQQERGSILIGHDKGLFRLKNFKPERVGTINGIWKVIAVKGSKKKYLAAGYSGLYPLSYAGDNWKLESKIKGFDESSRDILQINNSFEFWICHGYKGVYRLKLDERLDRVYALEHFTDQNGLQSSFNVNVTTYKDTIVFTTNTGIYNYDAQKNLFTPYKPLNDILNPNLNTRKLLTDTDKIWFVQDDEVGYFSSKNAALKTNLFLNLKGNLNRGMESILPLDSEHVLIGATNGLFMYNLKEKTVPKASTKITQVTYLTQGQLQDAIDLNSAKYLPTQLGMLRFEFASPQLTPSSQKEYQYKLEGIDTEWSPWSTYPYKEYTHPPAGEYTFKVRSRNYMGQNASEASLAFIIPHPWYQTTLAYIIYFILLLCLSFLCIQLINKKIEKEREKEKVAAQKSKKLLELEIEQLKLEKDKALIKKHKEQLEEDNLIKSKELANYTMLLVKKKEIFSDTFQALKDFRNSLRTQAARKRLQEVLFNLNQHRMGEEYLNVFDVHFEKVHENFFNRLKELEPSISKRELRLCAFVKMNLTNKEIAPLLNISTRGVETARYRIRKKLNVNDESFHEFLEALNPELNNKSY